MAVIGDAFAEGPGLQCGFRTPGWLIPVGGIARAEALRGTKLALMDDLKNPHLATPLLGRRSWWSRTARERRFKT